MLLILISNSTFGQKKVRKDKVVNISYEDLLKLKIDENIYELGWLPNSYKQIPCFRDYREDNLEMRISNKNNEEIILPETPQRNSLKIVPHVVSLNLADSTFIIRGKVTGAWEGVTPNEFNLYIGQRVDTISDITLSPNLHGKVFYNGEEVKETIVVDKVNAFYLKNFHQFKCAHGQETILLNNSKEMFFDIVSKINENSIFVVGLGSTYAEIFEINKLFSLIKYKRKTGTATNRL